MQSACREIFRRVSVSVSLDAHRLKASDVRRAPSSCEFARLATLHFRVIPVTGAF